MLRKAPLFAVLLLTTPVLAGLLGVLFPALTSGGESFSQVFAWPGFRAALTLSIKVGVVSTLIAFAVVLVLIAMLQGTAVFAWIERVLAPLLSIPHAAAALGIAFFITPSGWFARMISPWLSGWERPPDLLTLHDPGGWALILGLAAKEVPFLLLMALAALPQCDAPRRMLVAQSLGAGRLGAFIVTVLPNLYRQLRLPVYAVLAYAMTTVDMAIILGPSLPPPLSVQIVTWMSEPTLMYRGVAAAAALLQLAAVLAVLLVWRGAEWGVRAVALRWTQRGLRLVGFDAPFQAFGTAAAAALVFMLVSSALGLLLWSFTQMWLFPDVLPQSYTLRTWMRAFPSLMENSAETLRIAGLATLAAAALTLACLEAEHRFGFSPGTKMLWVLYVPLIVPQIAFLPGLQELALRGGLQGHWAAVAALHVVFVLPYVFLALAPAYRAWDSRIALVGAALGAAPNRVFWRLRIPMLLRALLTTIAVGMAISIGQYLPTLLIGGGRVETLTTEAVALSSGGNRRLIGAYGALQMVLPALGFMLALGLPRLVFRNRRAMGETQ